MSRGRKKGGKRPPPPTRRAIHPDAIRIISLTEMAQRTGEPLKHLRQWRDWLIQKGYLIVEPVPPTAGAPSDTALFDLTPLFARLAELMVEKPELDPYNGELVDYLRITKGKGD